MNQHTELPNDDHAALPEPVASPSRLFAGFTEVTWALVGTGFLLGILIGAVFIVGRGGTSDGETSGFASLATSESPATLVATTSATQPAAKVTDLAAEREELTRELEAEKLRLEVESLRQELAGLQSSTVSVESAGVPVPTSPEPSRSTTLAHSAKSLGAATLTYWNRLNAIILQEGVMRSAPAGGVTAANAGQFLESRIQAAEFAFLAIHELETTDVDRRVLSMGKKLATWYEQGREVAQSGMQLLTKASTDERQGSPGKKYQAAERSHSTAVNELNSDGERVRQTMTQKYRLDFPPLN